MSRYMTDPAVRPNADGTITIVDEVGGDWLLVDTGEGWMATHPRDGFDGPPFATADDAVLAVLGDPDLAERWPG